MRIVKAVFKENKFFSTFHVSVKNLKNMRLVSFH